MMFYAKETDVAGCRRPGITQRSTAATLGEHGRSLWQRVQSEYDVRDAGGIELLVQACEALDRVGRLREQIDADGEVIRARGTVRAHPALRDELAGRAFITRTLARLGLDVERVRSSVGRPPGRGW
jgi:hypothetical protein